MVDLLMYEADSCFAEFWITVNLRTFFPEKPPIDISQISMTLERLNTIDRDYLYCLNEGKKADLATHAT